MDVQFQTQLNRFSFSFKLNDFFKDLDLGLKLCNMRPGSHFVRNQFHIGLRNESRKLKRQRKTKFTAPTKWNATGAIE